MWILAFIALGGAAGAVSRYLIGLAALSIAGASLQPIATLIVNVLGSGLLGVCYALIGLGFGMSDNFRGLVMIGFLGALTTFSSFSLDAISLIEKGHVAAGITYVFGSVILSLFAFLLAVVVVRGMMAGH